MAEHRHPHQHKDATVQPTPDQGEETPAKPIVQPPLTPNPPNPPETPATQEGPERK